MIGINVSIMKEIKNKIQHNEGILREIRNRIMKEIWSIIPTSLIMLTVMFIVLHILQSACKLCICIVGW